VPAATLGGSASPGRPGSSAADVGWHRLARTLAGSQVALVALSVVACAALGLRVRWLTAATPMAVVALTLATATAVARRAGTSPLRWMIPEGLLVFALVVSLCVFSLPAQYAGAALDRPTIDGWLAGLDAAMGIHVPAVVTWTRAHPGLSHALAVAYDSFGLQVLVAAPVLVLLGSRAHLWEFAWHLHLCLIATLACFALFPAACAFNYYGFASTLPQDVFTAHFNGFRSGALTTIDFRDVTGLVSAPSFHVAGALLITWAARSHWWAVAPLAILNGMLCAATVLSGAHYAVDTVLSLGLFALSLVAWRRWGRHLL
jgi:hypothetical protein